MNDSSSPPPDQARELLSLIENACLLAGRCNMGVTERLLKEVLRFAVVEGKLTPAERAGAVDNVARSSFPLSVSEQMMRAYEKVTRERS